mgnify:CR=1 FL=1
MQVFYQAAFEDDDHVYLVMELCEGGSLLSRVTKGKETEKSIADIARSILRFVAQCHARVRVNLLLVTGAMVVCCFRASSTVM